MFLKTQRLAYRKFIESDFEDYFSLVGNDLIMERITGKGLSIEVAKKRFEMNLAQTKSFLELGFYRVETQVNPTFIGLGKIIWTQEEEAEIGYSLLPKNWGQGYGTEIAQCMLEMGRQTDYLKQLIAITDPDNEPSNKILLNLGFEIEAVFEEDGLQAQRLRLEL